MPRDHAASPLTLNAAQERYATGMADVLVYTVVLNLFDEYVDAVRIDSFTISVLTAVLLRVLLEATSLLEHRVVARFEGRTDVGSRVVEFGLVFAILFFSKLLILEVVDVVFRGRVELGHFVEVVALIVVMIAARAVGLVAAGARHPSVQAGRLIPDRASANGQADSPAASASVPASSSSRVRVTSRTRLTSSTQIGNSRPIGSVTNGTTNRTRPST